MKKEWLYLPLLAVVLTGVLLGCSPLQEAATSSNQLVEFPQSMEENDTKTYVLKEFLNLNVADPTVFYPCRIGKSGTNLVKSASYSNNGVTTWSSATGGLPSPIWDAVYFEGNNVWILDTHGSVYEVWKSTDNGQSYTQYGIDIDLTGLAAYESSDPVGIIANVGSITTCLVFFLWGDTGGVNVHLRAVEWNAGTSAWDESDDIIMGFPMGYQQHTNIVWDSTNTAAYFPLLRTGAGSANYFTVIMKWVSGAPDVISVEYSMSAMNPANDNFQMSNAAKFILQADGHYLLSGNLYSDAGVLGNGILLRSALHDLTSWEIVWQSTDTSFPYVIEGTSPRMWIVSGVNSYLSHNDGLNFFPVTHDMYDSSNVSFAATLTSGMEAANSDRGLIVFYKPGAYFYEYTMQEATWNDLFAEETLKIYAGADPGTFKALVDSASKTRFIDGMVVCVFDDAGNIMFEGKMAFTEQDEGLFSLQALEISEELERIKPTGTYTAQTAAQILIAMINTNCAFCYQSSSIVSSATTYTINFKGEKSLAQILDEFADLEDYIWYKAGDGKITFDDGTTASGTSYDATTAVFAIPKISSEGYKFANRIEGRGKVETDGPVFYAADDHDDQTRNGVWVMKFTQPTWGYAEVKACADNLLAARKSWSNIFSMLIEETLTLRPGTTVVMANFSTDFGIDDGTYIIMGIEHAGEGFSKIVFNNNAISSKDWAREQEYAANAMKDLFTKPDITESASASTEVPMEAEDEMLARILRHATSEANAITIIYDSTHLVKMWVDSTGALQFKPVGTGGFVFDKTTGTATFYIKATGGAGTEDVWLYLDAEDDSAILFQENGSTKGYVKWDKGDADLIIDSAGDIVLTPVGVIKLTGALTLAATGITAMPTSGAFGMKAVTVTGAWTTITALAASAAMILMASDTNTNYKWLGFVYNNAGTAVVVTLSSQTTNIQISGGNVQLQTTNAQTISYKCIWVGV